MVVSLVIVGKTCVGHRGMSPNSAATGVAVEDPVGLGGGPRTKYCTFDGAMVLGYGIS